MDPEKGWDLWDRTLRAENYIMKERGSVSETVTSKESVHPPTHLPTQPISVHWTPCGHWGLGERGDPLLPVETTLKNRDNLRPGLSTLVQGASTRKAARGSPEQRTQAALSSGPEGTLLEPPMRSVSHRPPVPRPSLDHSSVPAPRVPAHPPMHSEREQHLPSVGRGKTQPVEAGGRLTPCPLSCPHNVHAQPTPKFLGNRL